MNDFFSRLFKRRHARSQTPREVPIPPGLERGEDIPWEEGGSVRCLATATFLTETNEACGRMWLLSSDPELMNSHGTDAALPNVFSARGFDSPLGVITANGFGDSFFKAEPSELNKLLTAIRDADASKLYDLDREYVPFYCPTCRLNYGRAQWSAVPVFDDGFFDFLEGRCVKGHRRIIHD